MLKLATILLSLLFLIPATYADSWDDFSNIDRMWDGQKSITNTEFEQVMDALEEKGKVKEEKKKKKLFKRMGGGTSLHKELNPSNEISEVKQLKEDCDDLLLNTPVDLLVNEKTLERGFYKVLGERDKENNKIYINFYQSQFFRGKIEAIETQEDYNEEQIDFVRLLPHNENFVKIIFGSIDFNAYAFVPYNQ